MGIQRHSHLDLVNTLYWFGSSFQMNTRLWISILPIMSFFEVSFRSTKKRCSSIWLIFALTFSFRPVRPVSMIKFTNIKCVTLDKGFAEFAYCKLKALSRDEVALSLRVNLFEIPVNNISLNMEVFKRFNGYRPFLFNKTVNFCEFLRNKKRVGVLDIIFKFLVPYSNINHTCPYSNNIVVDGLILKPNYFALLPLPAGEYRIKITVGAYNDWKATVNVFLQTWE